MSAMELIGAVAVVLGALVSMRMLLRGAERGVSTPLTEEQLEALEKQLEALDDGTAVVLLADDSVTIQKVVELTFMDTHIKFVCVSDGKSATDLLERVKKFDAVIADVHMPARNGYEVCKYAKKLYPKIPVLLLVGTFERFDVGLYSECGADKVLKKPFDSRDLVKIMSRLLPDAVQV